MLVIFYLCTLHSNSNIYRLITFISTMQAKNSEQVRVYERPESELILIEHTDFILYDLPPVDDEGEDDW